MTLDLETLDLPGLDFDRDLPGARDLQRQLDAARAEFLAMLSPPLEPVRQDALGSRPAPPAPNATGSDDPSAGSTP